MTKDTRMKCSDCESKDLVFLSEPKPAGTLMVVSIILFFPAGLLFLLLRGTQVAAICKDCGYKWIPPHMQSQAEIEHISFETEPAPFEFSPVGVTSDGQVDTPLPKERQDRQAEEICICENCGNQIFEEEQKCSNCSSKKEN